MSRSSVKRSAMRITLAAILTALSLIFLYLSCLVPTGKVGLVALAGLFPAAAVVSFGFSAGFLCYAGTGILALLLLADKGMAMLYLLFFGLYPMIKGRIEQLRCLPAEVILKLVVFNLLLLLILTVFRSAFFTALPLMRWSRRGIAVFCSGVFLMYDYGFSKWIGFYRQNVDRVLRKS